MRHARSRATTYFGRMLASLSILLLVLFVKNLIVVYGLCYGVDEGGSC